MTDSLSPAIKRAMTFTAVRGEGCLLFDADGRSYLDFTAGIAVTSTGHCHPAIVEAVRHQAGQLVHAQQATVLHQPLADLADRLVGLTHPGIESFLFGSAGAEAVEAAVRLAKHATGRTNIVAFQGGFHGRTAGALSLTTSKYAYRSGLAPLMGGVFTAPFPASHRYGWSEEQTVAFCLRELDHLLQTQTGANETAALIIEPVLGEGGYVPAPVAFLEGLQERARKHGILFILDEIQTGIARTGAMWAYEHGNLQPDILTVAKGVASGYPLSAMGASRALMDKAWPGSQGGTYGGNAVSCAAALATLDVVEKEDLVSNARDRGAQLVIGLNALQDKHSELITDVRGLGLMVACEMGAAIDVPHLLAAAEQAGLMLLACGPDGKVVRWMPPLVVSEREVTQALEIFGGLLADGAGR